MTYAIAQVCAISIISDHWSDEEQRASMVGYYNAAQAAAGAIMSFVSGNLAASGWTAAYHTYWIAVPVLVMVALFIPRMSANKREERYSGVRNRASSAFFSTPSYFATSYHPLSVQKSPISRTNPRYFKRRIGALAAIIMMSSQFICALSRIYKP